jgi:pullulanase
MQKKALFVGLLSLAMALPLASCGGTSNAASTDAYSGPTYDTESIRIHYHRKDGVYTGWALWLWDKALNNGTEYAFNGSDSYGACASYALSTFGANVVNDSMGFIVKSAGSWSAKDPDGDRFINFSLYKKDANNVYHVYLESGDKGIYADANHSVADAITDAHFSFMNKIYVSTTNVMKHLALYEDDVALFNGDVGKNFYLYTFDTGKQADFEKHYYAEATFESGAVVKTVVAITSLYKTADFDNKYTYDGDLGALYTSSETQFKVWSPISSSIKLRVYGNGTPKSLSATLGNDTYDEYTMTKGDKGVWSYTVSGDLAGKYYTYFVTNSTYPSGKEIVDPYAKSAGVNGVRGMIVDFSATNPDGWDNFTVAHPYDRKAEVVYETAIPDLTGSSTWGGTSAKQGKFTGFYETGTKTTSTDNSGASVQISTGFDHVKDLGVNAVQIMPMFDSDNNETGSDYNWGYNPLNYNVVEGRYSSNPYDGLVRIKELKSLVKAYYDAGINIIMDVVYNHTSSLTGTNFDVLMPGYYYRYVGTTPSNGSGCGNETASEMPMFRKFMIDSTTFWTKEYKLGGFRFDLMGLHDIPTMNKIAAACKAINPKVTIYGEPWAGGTSALNTETPATQANGNSYEGYGQFNDGMRDALIKGGLNAASTTGWISNTASAISESDKASITKGIKGTTQSGSNNIPDPDKTTNYVTCHDNYTLYDRFYYGNKITDEAVVKKMNLLAQSVVMTSDGTSFMLSGEEMLRTKKGSSNSYNLDITYNALNYAKVAKNQDLLESYKKLINFKKTVTGVQADKSSVALATTWNSASNMFYYDVVDATSGRTYRVVHANGLGTPGTVDLSGYSLYLDTLSRTDLTLSASTRVDNYETIIAYK